MCKKWTLGQASLVFCTEGIVLLPQTKIRERTQVSLFLYWEEKISYMFIFSSFVQNSEYCIEVCSTKIFAEKEYKPIFREFRKLSSIYNINENNPMQKLAISNFRNPSSAYLQN